MFRKLFSRAHVCVCIGIYVFVIYITNDNTALFAIRKPNFGSTPTHIRIV